MHTIVDSQKLTSAEYGERNAELFVRRLAIQNQLSDFAGSDDTAMSGPDTRRHRRLLRELDEVTTEIVRLNTPLVRDYVGHFTGAVRGSGKTEDFMGAGMVGLMRAIASYNPELGSFASWSFNPVKREVLKAVRDADHPNMNHTDFEARPKIRRAREILAKASGLDAEHVAVGDVAAVAGATPEQVVRVLHAPHLVSLHAPVGGDDGTSSVGELIPDAAVDVERSVQHSISVSALEEFGLPCLDDRERFVIVRRFGLDGEPPMRLSTIGKLLQLSREAARQIEGKAIAKLSHPCVMRKLVRAGRT